MLCVVYTYLLTRRSQKQKTDSFLLALHGGCQKNPADGVYATLMIAVTVAAEAALIGPDLSHRPSTDTVCYACMARSKRRMPGLCGKYNTQI